MDGNLQDEMFHWHILRRKLIEDSKQRQASAASRQATATSSGLKSVAKWFGEDVARAQKLESTVRNIDPESARFGEVAKDIVKSGNDVTFDMSGKTEKEVIIAKRAERSSFGGTGIYNGESAVVSKYFRSRAKQKAARIDRHGDIKEALEAALEKA